MKGAPRILDTILATLDAYSDACSRQDVEAALTVFATDDEVFLMGSEGGETARGPEEIRRFHERVLARPGSYAWTWDWRMVSVRGSVAWIAAAGQAWSGLGEERTSVPYRVTVVLEEKDGRWLWLQFHGSEPK